MCDPMQEAILDVLERLPAADAALEALFKRGDTTARRRAYALSGRVAAGQMFEERDLDDLERFLDPLLREIRAGTKSAWINSDECSSGGWVETRMTHAAEALQETCAPLIGLHRAMRRVRDLRRAHRVQAKIDGLIA